MISGVIRRIDELGRICIPKEIRRTLGMTIGEPVEITCEGKRLVLTKYSSCDEQILNDIESALEGLESFDEGQPQIEDAKRLIAAAQEILKGLFS